MPDWVMQDWTLSDEFVGADIGNDEPVKQQHASFTYCKLFQVQCLVQFCDN